MKDIFLFFCFLSLAIIARSQRYDITQYGVIADSTSVQTTAIQNVIDKAAENGGGIIIIPRGVYYYVDSFSIAGPGTINGNGTRFWQAFWPHRDTMNKAKKPWTNLEVHRPRLIFEWSCNNMSITDIKLCNAGYWTTHLYQCNSTEKPFGKTPTLTTGNYPEIRTENVTVNGTPLILK